jgi:hypothetical protein
MMSGQKSAGWIVPENQTSGHQTDSSKTNKNPPGAGEENYEEGRSQPGVAGQGADQLTETDRARLEGE